MDFIQKAKIIHGEKYNYDKVIYINNKIKVIITCLKHGDFEVTPSHHTNIKIGCHRCSNLHRRTNEEFIKEIIKEHGTFYNYSLVDFKNIRNKIKIICPKHGKFEQRAGHHLAGHGCPRCNDSKGEKTINKWLLDNNIDFKREFGFQDCKSKKNRKLRFDFWLPDYNLCIEFDGPQHNKISRHFGLKSFEVIQENDKIKNEYCSDKDINLLRIKYEQHKQEEKILQILKQAIMQNQH